MSEFVHLHLHTQYSLLDGANKITEVVARAADYKQPAIAMTDHGNMHGAVEFYVEAEKHGIKPIIGCELYVNPLSRHERKTVASGGAGTFHLTVLAKNNTGYRNLCRLVSQAYKEGFYFKPRVDHELLAEYSEGLVVMSGCLSSELGRYTLGGRDDKIKETLDFYQGTFGDNYFLEIQPHPIDEQQKLNAVAIELAKERGIPLVATTDCHYGEEADHQAQEVLMCIATGKQITDPNRMRHEGVKLHFKSAEEMREEFGGITAVDEALASTVRIAEECSVSFDFNTYHMPQYKTDSERSLIELMTDDAREGLAARLTILREMGATIDEELEAVYRERLEDEIQLIDKMGFAGYFLVVADFIVWAKEHDIPVGPGRGSAAGSLVAYSMRITDIDPIEHKLLFERFLNPERISLPDIDVDFCINGRDDVIKYVVEKYGKDQVAQIATFGTLKAKAAIKDVGRALGISYAETDRVAQLIPAPRQGFDYPIKEALDMEPRLKDYAESEGRELISLAMRLEGLTRHSSTHAAGVVIAHKPLMDLLPMMVDKDGNDVTQFSMNYVEKVGLVKFDFLGLKTLTVIHTALRLIRESQGVDINLEMLPMTDELTYQILCEGKTIGVFQLESSGITEMTVRLKPSRFDDLVAILALYRPGPLDAGMVDHYINRKAGREPVEYLHESMSTILNDTYGIILYQEQIMQLARELAGYSLAEADILRKAMGKKIPEEMAKQRKRFLSGAQEKGLELKLATEIFDQMETFARYGFNRSHSAAYALISYHTAYLKAHYPVEFMAALMSLEMGDSDKTLKNINECRKQKIEVLPPDVNFSGADFGVDDGRVRFGLAAVKGIGEKAVQAIVESREEEGPFVDLEDFVSRVDLKQVNRKVVECLIKCGAFDFAPQSRHELFERHEEVYRGGVSYQKDRDSSQISIFGAGSDVPPVPRRTTDRPEWPTNKKLRFEREALGFYIAGHPLGKFKRELSRIGVITTEEASKARNGAEVQIGGVVTALRLKNTKKGDRYASFYLEDHLGSMDALVWPDVYQKSAQYLASDDPIVASARVDVTEERCVLIINRLESLIELRDRNARRGVLNLSSEDKLDESLPELVRILKLFHGNCPVQVSLELTDSSVDISLKDESDKLVCVRPSEELCDRVEEIFGRPVMSFL